MPPKRTAPTKEAPAKAASTANASRKKRAAPADEPPATAAGKKAKKAAAPAPEEADDDDGDDDDGDDDDGDDAAAVANEREILASLSDVSAEESDSDNSAIEDEEDDNANSSDEDDEDDRAAAASAPRSSLASIKLPNSKDDAVVKARLDKLRKSKSASGSSSTPGVLYIGRLPKGFFEKQMKGYFSQFGDVTRLRVSRNKKTGASKHYAFIEFADKDVASIVRETMDNYLIDGRLLQVKEIPRQKVHPELWVGANRKYRPVPGARRERVIRRREKTEEEQQRTIERKLRRQDDRREKLKKAGIDYEFEGYTKESGEEKNETGKRNAKPSTAAKAKVAKGKAVKA